MTPPSDDDVRARFGRLRSDLEREGVPDFSAMMGRARAEARIEAQAPIAIADRRRWLRTGGWASAAIAAAVVGLLLTSDTRAPDPDEEFERLVASFATDESSGAWRSPTDALLNVPGSDLMRSMPSVGAAMPGIELPTPPNIDRPGDTL